jgi:hypothetical protein
MASTTPIEDLTAQTTDLLDACLTLKAGVATQIADAVAVSTNAAILPMMSMTAHLVTTQAWLITLATRATP